MRITSTLPDALDSLLGAIIEAKGVVTLCNWLLSVNLGQFVSTLDAKDDAEQRYFIAKELYAFSSCYGLEHMIVELFPSLDAVLELAQHWFGPNEDPDNPIGQDQYEIFFYWCCEQAFEDAPNYRTLCAIVHTLLEHRPAVHKYFEVHNYGLENIKGRIDKLQVRILSTNNVLGTDELRDKYKDLGSISKDLEALLKLMLLFYQTHFCQDANNDQRFALANECFAEAVEQSKNGLSPTLQAMRSIDSFFENGESNGQRRNRVQRFEEAIIQLTNQYQINRVSYLERENALRKIESDYHNQRESCRIRLAMERELAQDGVTISNLNDQIIELSSSIEAVNQQIKNVEDIRKNEEAQLADKINLTKKNDDKEVKQRKQVAEELRRKCMAVFQRTTPFGTLSKSH